MRSAATFPAPGERLGRLPALIDHYASRLENRLIRAVPWQVMQVPARESIVSFTFDAQGARQFAEITRDNVGRPFAIVLEGKVLTAPVIREPMRDILFDEKIAGSFHFTPGQAYEIADNGNRSQVHWDMVNIQRKDYGGGEIRFDGKLIRKDGIFLPKSLAKLNG